MFNSQNQDISNLREELRKANNIIKEQKNEIEKLKIELNNANNNIAEIVQSLQDQIDLKDKELKQLKIQLENKNNKFDPIIHESQIATVYFTSTDQKVNYAIPCVNNTTFAEIEEKLYKEFPEYRETNNTFIANGKQVLRFKSIEDNKIGNGKPVMLVVPEDE